ncbi:hypothetical protein Trydic_g17860 [Trypoxylus dichotomus]
MVQKIGNFVPRELKERNIERRLVTCETYLQRQGKKSFLHRIITSDEKLIHYNNPKRKIAWVKLGEPDPSIPKRNIYGLKVILCIWWDMWGVVYYELLKPFETVNSILQPMRMKQVIQEKQPEWRDRHEELILQCRAPRPDILRRGEMRGPTPLVVFTSPFRLPSVPIHIVGRYWRALYLT